MVIPSRRSSRVIAPGLVIAGAVAATGHAPLYLWYLAFPALALVLGAICLAATVRQAVWFGWLAGLGYIGGTHFWITQPFFVDAARHGWMAPFALFFMAAGLALLWGLAYGVAYWIGRSSVLRLVILALCMTAMEWLRLHLFTGFPWAAASAMWMPFSVIQLLSIAGPVGMALFTYGLLVLPALLLQVGRIVAVCLAVFGCLIIGAANNIGDDLVKDVPGTTEIVVRVVQPNAPQHEKWQRDLIPVFFERQLDLSAYPLDAGIKSQTGRPDVVIWPETSVAYGIHNRYGALSAIAEAAQTTVIFGSQRREGQRFFNSLAVMRPDAEIATTYDKHHLVPFGEFIPFGGLLSTLGIRGLAAAEGGGYSAGAGPSVWDLGPLGQVLPLICYEAIFPGDVGGAPKRADWILHATNDAWFGTSAMPYQHLDQARMRAIEQGLPVIRSANTGISAIIDARGHVLQSLLLEEDGKIDSYLPSAAPKTLYSRTGNLPWITFVFVTLLGCFLARRRNVD
ncbi:MAG: apolipoprotein N-acyltransferase [Pseudoruegeria sp.]